MSNRAAQLNMKFWDILYARRYSSVLAFCSCSICFHTLVVVRMYDCCHSLRRIENGPLLIQGQGNLKLSATATIKKRLQDLASGVNPLNYLCVVRPFALSLFCSYAPTLFSTLSNKEQARIAPVIIVFPM